MALDERLRRAFEGAGEPADPSGVYEDLIRRRERRRMTRRLTLGAVSVAVVAACIVGVVILSRVFAPTESRPGADGGVAPSIQPEPTPTDVPPPGEDIGLGVPVCNISSIEGRFASSKATATAFVATEANDAGGCPQPEEAFDVVALDIDGDGLAETSFGPIECTLDCRAFSAPDIDGDGTDELLIVEGGGSVLLLGLYDFIATEGALEISPVIVAEPGDPRSFLFEPGEPARFLIGGDGFGLDGMQCGDVSAPDGPGIVATSAESLPHDSPDAEWHAHQTTLALRSDGLLHVVDIRDFIEPVTDDPRGPSFRSGETLCGSNLGP